ncbi:MAG: hypothetical protein ACPGNV_05995 [Mangrovicoccus sp.]
MSQENPTLDDYLRIFAQYGEEVQAIYMEPPDDRYELLFERMIRLLIKPSQFNLTLPEEFRIFASQYRAGDADVVRQLEDRDTRHFMLSEVHDYIMLTGGLARRRAMAEPDK